jgi:hypothetical protein
MPMLDGLITFFASHHAIRAEKVLRDADFTVELVPGPKELSPNCGTALRIEHDRADAAVKTLAAEKVEVDEIIKYVPRTDQWTKRRRRFARKP